MQTWMPASFSERTSGMSSAAWNVGSPPEEGLLVDGHAEDLRGVGQLALPGFDRVGIGAVETAEITALQENDEPESRPVESSHRFVRMYTKHNCSLFLNKGFGRKQGPVCESGFHP